MDRTELSKNIVRGLAAYRELLATRPQWRGRVVHLAFAYPSRSDLAEYRAYTERVRQLALEITGEFGTADWNPLILEVKDDYPRSLAACALADVLLVNPIRDGMNLVAQEGPVLSERGCALVLSREAGAAATLAADALLVNPYDITETAEALHQALAMPDAERQRRSAALAATAAADPPARLARRPARLARLRDQGGYCDRGGIAPARSVQCLSWPASAVSSSTTPAGPSTTRSAASATCGDSALALATAQPGTPSARSARTAAKAGRSPRSSPQNRTERAARSPARPVSAVPLSTPGGRSSMTKRPGSAASPSRSASSPSGPRSWPSAASGSAVPRVCTATACALSSTQVPSGAPASRSTPGRARAGGRHGGRGRRVGQLAVLPALAAVVADHHEAGDGRETAQGHRVRRGPAGDDRDRAHRPGQRGQGGHRAGVGAGVARAGHDRRQRAVEVRGDQRVPRVREQRVEAGLALRGALAGAASPGVPSCPSAAANASAAAGPAAPAAS